MTTAPSTPLDDDEADRLDRLLDALSRGGDAAEAESGLAIFARRLHASTSREDDRTLADTDVDRSWERLVGPPGLVAVPADRPRRGRDDRLGIVAPGGLYGWRAASHGAARLALALAAVLVLVMTALTLSRQGPGSSTTPTVMAAEAHATVGAGELTVSAPEVHRTATRAPGTLGYPALCATAPVAGRRAGTTGPAVAPSRATLTPDSGTSRSTTTAGCILGSPSSEAAEP